MARYYSDLDSPTNGNGLSWDTPFNTFRTAVGTRSPGDDLWVKEHDGYLLTNSTTFSNAGVYVLGGFDSGLTGTDGDPDERTGLTNLYADSVGFMCLDFTSSGDNCSVSRLLIKGFKVSSYNGGGIRVTDATGVVLEDIAVVNCICNNPYGGGLYSNVDVTIKRSTFFRNVCQGSGGGIMVAAKLIMEDSMIRNNVCGETTSPSGSQTGGGIYALGAEIDRCFIIGNKARDPDQDGDKGFAGGLNIESTSGTNWIRDSVIAENEAEHDIGGLKIFRYLDVVNCTIINNHAFGASSTIGGVDSDTNTTLTNSIVRDNSAIADNIQVYGFPSNSVEYCTIDGASGVSGGLSGQEGDGCVDENPIYYSIPSPSQYDLDDDTDESVLRGGDVGVSNYSGVDINNNSREAEPTMGAYEVIIETETEVAPLTPDEIINNFVNQEDTEYWTEERIDNILVIDTDPVYLQRIYVTLDDIPLMIRILRNYEYKSYFANIKSNDGSISLQGIRLSPGLDLLDGMAVPELGKLFITDMQLKKGEPTKTELGDRFVLWYLPRDYV